MKPATRSSSLRNFHLPLPEDLHRRLREEAERAGMPATELARQAIRQALKARQRESLHSAVSRYAAGAAGTSHDLDDELEAAAIDHLLGRRRFRRRGEGPRP